MVVDAYFLFFKYILELPKALFPVIKTFQRQHFYRLSTEDRILMN